MLPETALKDGISGRHLSQNQNYTSNLFLVSISSFCTESLFLEKRAAFLLAFSEPQLD